MKDNLDSEHASIGNIVIEYDDYSYSDECKGVLVSPKYVFVPEHCRSNNTTPKRIRIGLAGQIVDLKTSPIEFSDIYSIYEIDPPIQSLTVNPAMLGVQNPKPDSELVSRKGDFTSRCYFGGWWPNAAEFDLKCHTAGTAIRVGEIYGWFFFDGNNKLTAFRANPHHINAVVPSSYVLARSQILKSIVANRPPLQPAQSATATLPNSLNERIKLWRKQVKYCDCDPSAWSVPHQRIRR